MHLVKIRYNIVSSVAIRRTLPNMAFTARKNDLFSVLMSAVVVVMNLEVERRTSRVTRGSMMVYLTRSSLLGMILSRK